MTDPDPRPIQQHDDRVTIATAPMLAAVYRATLAGIARRRADGLPAGDLQELTRALYRAHSAAMSAGGHRLDETPTNPTCSGCHGASDLISTTEAARILSVSPRQVRRLAAGNSMLGGGHRIGNALVLLRAPTMALKQEREAK